jgi:hypothetical protein
VSRVVYVKYSAEALMEHEGPETVMLTFHASKGVSSTLKSAMECSLLLRLNVRVIAGVMIRFRVSIKA